MSAGFRKLAMKALRTTWVLLAISFVAHFVLSRWQMVAELAHSLHVWQFVTAFFLIFVGKIVYTEVVRLMLSAGNPGIGFRDAFYAYNISQLGKYIPGSVWQFVGRYEIYRRYGVDTGRVVQIMILENGLMLGTALLVGIAALPFFVGLAFDFLARNIAAMAGLTFVLTAGCAFFAMKWRAHLKKVLQTLLKHHALVRKSAALFVLMWCFLGLSIFTIFAGLANVSAVFVVSLFALSYLVGFVAVFAPAGVGVRDVMFTIGLTGIVEPQAALLLTVGHRLVYILADILCGLYAWSVFRGRASSDHSV